jgi:hypothetical protein
VCVSFGSRARLALTTKRSQRSMSPQGAADLGIEPTWFWSLRRQLLIHRRKRLELRPIRCRKFGTMRIVSKIWDDANRSVSGRTPRMIRQVFCVGWRAAASPPPESCGWSWRSGLGGAPTTGGRQPPGANVQLSRTALRRLRQSGERPGADKLRKPFDSGLRKCCTDRPTKQQPRSVISLDQRPTP